MNNSKFAIESVQIKLEEPSVDKSKLREFEQDLSDIIGAIRTIAATKEWSSLKIKVFDPLVTTLNRDITQEAKKEIPDTLKLNRLAGQLKWAEKYSNLDKLEDMFRMQLLNVKKQLYGETKTTG